MPSTAADRLIVNPASIDEDHIHVVAAVIWQREDRDRLLIAQRQKGKHLQDYWEFPGGKVEAGESRWQALQRELEEEISIRALQGQPFMQVYYRYPERNVLLDVWVVDAYAGDVSAGEQQALRWIDVSQIDDFRYPPADIPVIEAIKSNATTGIRRFP